MIVLLEGDLAIRSVTCELLREQGHPVYAAGSPEAVGRTLESMEVDLVLADPTGATKDQAIDSLRRLVRLVAGKTTVVAFTAHKVSPEEARAAGCADVIGKPFDIDELIGCVQGHMGGGKERVYG